MTLRSTTRRWRAWWWPGWSGGPGGGSPGSSPASPRWSSATSVSHQLRPSWPSDFPGDPVVARALAMLVDLRGGLGGRLPGRPGVPGDLAEDEVRGVRPAPRDAPRRAGRGDPGPGGRRSSWSAWPRRPGTRSSRAPRGSWSASVMQCARAGPARRRPRDALAPFVEESKQADWTAEKVVPLLPTADEVDAEAKRTSHMADDGTD